MGQRDLTQSAVDSGIQRGPAGIQREPAGQNIGLRVGTTAGEGLIESGTVPKDTNLKDVGLNDNQPEGFDEDEAPRDLYKPEEQPTSRNNDGKRLISWPREQQLTASPPLRRPATGKEHASQGIGEEIPPKSARGAAGT